MIPLSGATPESDEKLRQRFRCVRIAAYLILVVAFAGQMLARKWFRTAPPGDRGFPIMAFLVSMGFFVFACCLYARVKGRSAWFGLLGLLSLIGCLVLLYMKKSCHRCGTMAKDSADECPRCSAPM